MKKTTFNTGGALALATLAAGLSFSSNEVQAASCDFLDLSSGVRLPASALVTLTKAASYVIAGDAGCTIDADVTASTLNSVTDPYGIVTTSNKFIIPAAGIFNFAMSDNKISKVIFSAGGVGATVNVVAMTGATLELISDASDNEGKLTLVVKNDVTLKGPATLESTLSVLPGAQATLDTITTGDFKLAAPVTVSGVTSYAKIKTSGSATTITGK